MVGHVSHQEEVGVVMGIWRGRGNDLVMGIWKGGFAFNLIFL